MELDADLRMLAGLFVVRRPTTTLPELYHSINSSLSQPLARGTRFSFLSAIRVGVDRIGQLERRCPRPV
jgi:hypothetical protein